MKRVSVLAHQFDAVPGHITIRATGEGTNLCVAVKRAVDLVLHDRCLRHKQIGEFKMNVVVITDAKPT